MRLLFVVVFGLIYIYGIDAQVTIQETPKVKTFMENYIKVGKEEPYIDGWRIKLISTTNRRELDKARFLFESKYPDMVYEQSYESPYYSMKVGAFETRIDVEPLLVLFKEDFPLAIPFRDQVTKTELFAEDGE